MPRTFFLSEDLGVAIGLVDRPGRLAEVVELAELVGHAGQGLGLTALRIECWPSEITPAIGTDRPGGPP